MLSVNFNFLSVVLQYVYHQINYFKIYATLTITIAKYIVFLTSDSTSRICIQEPLLMIKKIVVLLNTLSAYNRLLVCYKFYSSDSRECLRTQAEGMVKPIKTLVLIQHHVERIL